MESPGASVLEIDDPAWTEFVVSHPASTVFHTPEWASVIADCYGFRTFAIVVYRDGKILSGCPVVEIRAPLGGRRWVSLPFTDECPLLTLEDTGDAVVKALSRLAHARNVTDFEIRSCLSASDGVYPLFRGYRHVVRLPTQPEDLHLRKSYRNLRNKAKREGVTIRRGVSTEDMDGFYRLHVMTRRRHGVPVQPKRFFDLIGRRLIEPGLGFILTAEYEGSAAAASIFLSHKDTLVTKYAASNPSVRDIGAGHLLDWVSLDSACREGYRLMDWGRTDVEAEGLRSYKLGWGAEEERLFYTHIARRQPRESRLRLGAAAQAVIRRSPEWMCRMLGELFYRGAA